MIPEFDSLSTAAHTNDGFFKAIFSQPEHATAFFKSHLPPAVVEEIDWSTLVVLPGSFVKTNLQKAHTDLLFSVSTGSRETLLYLLFEHQSSPAPEMPLRLLSYMLEILNQHHKQHGLPLPPVLPLVLNQGPQTWHVSTAFEDLFELPEELSPTLSPFLPKFSHALVDMTRFDPATRESDDRLRIVLQLMKLARQKELLRFFRWLADLTSPDVPEDLLTFMLLYSLHADSDLDVEAIYRNLSTNPELQESTMSVAEKLRAEGMAKGEELGNWKGKIQLMEQMMELPVSSGEALSAFSVGELQAQFESLQLAYKARFKA